MGHSHDLHVLNLVRNRITAVTVLLLGFVIFSLIVIA